MSNDHYKREPDEVERKIIRFFLAISLAVWSIVIVLAILHVL